MTVLMLDDDDVDDQFALALDPLTRPELGRRPPGDRPLGAPERYCHETLYPQTGRLSDMLFGAGVTCYGVLAYETDALGRMMTVCTRPACGHAALVPRRAPTDVPKVCPACGREIAGENEGRGAHGPSWCRRCKREKNMRQRERRRGTPTAADSVRRERDALVVAMRARGESIPAICHAVELSRSMVKRILSLHRDAPQETAA